MHKCQSKTRSSDTKTHMRVMITDKTKTIYSMYRMGEVSVHRICCERATQPYSLGGGGTIYPGSRPVDATTRSPRMVIECLLTRSALIKMYNRFMASACRCVSTIVITVSQFQNVKLAITINKADEAMIRNRYNRIPHPAQDIKQGIRNSSANFMNQTDLNKKPLSLKIEVSELMGSCFPNVRNSLSLILKIFVCDYLRARKYHKFVMDRFCIGRIRDNLRK